MKEPESPSGKPGDGAKPGDPVTTCPLECPTKVVFTALGKTWGWDDKTDAANPWMSLQTGKSDTVKAKAKDSAHTGRMCNVKYASSDSTIATVSPESGSSDGETVTVNGVKKGEVTITASCKGAEVGKFRVAVYGLKEYKVMMRLINHKNYTSTDVSKASVETYLNNMYKQAVAHFTVTKPAAKKVDFDADNSNNVDVSGSWPSGDVRKIIDGAGDASYDYQVFLVDKPNDGSLGWSGLSNADRAGVIHGDTTSEAPNTIAHEMGHGLFGLKHSDNDASNANKDSADTHNLMHSDKSGTTHLRKYQWDQIQAKAPM